MLNTRGNAVVLPTKVMSPLLVHVLELWTTTSPAGVGEGDVSPTCRAVVGAVGTRRSNTKGEPALSTFPFPAPLTLQR